MITKLVGDTLLGPNTILSIITVVRNDKARLANTIKSLEMIYGDARFEHIIVDSLSTDGTEDLLKKVAFKANVKVISEPDFGIYDAMNKGSNLSSGAFKLFLNCGDELLGLPEQIVKWCKDINPSLVDVACFSCVAQFGSRKLLLMPRGHTKYKMPTSHQAMIFSRSFLAQNPYNIEYRIAGDFELYLQSTPSRVFIFNDSKPLTLIQGEGFASTNPFISYKEYLAIAFKKYHGFSCLIALFAIFFKGAAAVGMKAILPMRWLSYMRAVK